MIPIMSSACPMEELLLDDPLAPGSDVEKNTLDQGEMVGARPISPKITIEDDQEAILVEEETNKCYTCHQEFVAGSPLPALMVHVQQNESSKLTIQVCLACYRRLDYDYSSGVTHQQFSGCPILPESKIIVNSADLSHKCFRCFEPLPYRSVHPVSLQDGIFNASCPAVLQESGYEFAVYLCDSCAHWKKFAGKMREVTTLKFPAFDRATRTLFLPPISNVQQQSNSIQTGIKSINYPVSMLVNKARSLMERFKDEASLSSPPTIITGCMMYIHTTKSKSSPSTHWSCDGFAFQKTSTRVVRIQNSDHVIRETNWVTAGPGDIESKFKRRTITSSNMEDITLVHYLGEVDKGIQASREVDLENEDTNTCAAVSPPTYNRDGPEFFTNNVYFRLLTSELPCGKLRQDYKLMPLATKLLLWNGEKWSGRLDTANGAVITEVVRLVMDCKLSPEAVAEAFDWVTPELMWAYIKQLRKLNIKNFDNKYNSWLSFTGPWLVQDRSINDQKVTSTLVQYLRVPVATNCKALLKCYINNPGRLRKVLRSEDTDFPQDKEVQLIKTLAKALVHQDQNKQKLQKLKKPSPLFANYPTSNFDDNPDDPDTIDTPGPVISDVHSTSSTDSAGSDDTLLPTISSVTGSVGGVTVMGSSSQATLPFIEGPILHSKIAARYRTSLVNRPSPLVAPQKLQIKKICYPVQPQTNPDHKAHAPMLPTQPLPFTATQTPPRTSIQTLAPKVVVSGNKIILPPNFMASGARLVQIPTSDGTKRLVLINSSQLMTTAKNTITNTTSVVTSIPSIPESIIVRPQTSLLPSQSHKKEDSIPSKKIAVEDEPEMAVDPLEIDASNNHPTNAISQQKSVPQTKMNHLKRSAAVQANSCAEIAEECIFNKSFSDVLIYGTTSSEQKNPLRTHSLLLAAISPNLKQLLQKAERNGEGVYELVIPGVALQEIEALMEEVIGTMLMPPKDDNSVTFTMSESLWTLFAGVRPEEAKLGKDYVQNKAVVSNSFSARVKSMESLTDDWAKQSVCDEQTGQMVIQMRTKRKIVESSTAQGSPKIIKLSDEMSRGGIKLSDWSKQVGSVKQKNIQEKDPCPIIPMNTVDSDDDDYEVVINSVEEDPFQMGPSYENSPMLNRYYNIYNDNLPIRAVSVDIKNLQYSDHNTVVYLASMKKFKNVDLLYPPCSSPDRDDFDLLTYHDDPLDNDYVPRGNMRTSSNNKGSMVKKKSPEKWIFNQ